MVTDEGSATITQDHKKSRRLIARAIALTWIAIAIMAGFFFYALHEFDAIALNNERALLRNGLGNAKSDLAEQIKPIAIWDEAVAKIHNAPDPDFMHENVGRWFADYLRIPVSLVISRDGATLYYYANGERAPLESAADWRSAMEPLLKRIREEEAADAFEPRWNGETYEPRMAVDFVQNGETMALVAISSVAPDFGHVTPTPGQSALIATILPLDQGPLSSIARATLLRDLDHGKTAETSGGQSAIALSTDGGLPAGYLRWRPDYPSDRILGALWKPAMAAALLLLVASFVTYRTTRRMADEIVTSEAKAIHIAQNDSLTGLPNRVLFASTVQKFLHKAEASHPAAVLLININHFKDINDTLGHVAGDQMLIQAAGRLKKLLTPNDMAARMGGDQFAIFLSEGSPSTVATFVSHLRDVLAAPYELVGAKTSASISVGVAVIDGATNDYGEIARHADLALNKARSSHPGSIVYFSAALDEGASLRAVLEADMRNGLKEGQFHLLYQPQIRAANTRLAGVEALLRWRHPTHGGVSPAIFIPLAERTGLIRDVSRFVLKQAFLDAHLWPNIAVSVNISPIYIRHQAFMSDVVGIAAETGVEPSQIGLEITEGALLDPSDVIRDKIERLKSLGFKIVLDDFGTGYSSLDYIHRYKFDHIKIDKSFVQSFNAEMHGPAIIQSVVNLSHTSGAEVVAEGVETAHQFEFLKEIGCDIIQGFYYFEPLPSVEISELARNISLMNVA